MLFSLPVISALTSQVSLIVDFFLKIIDQTEIVIFLVEKPQFFSLHV